MPSSISYVTQNLSTYIGYLVELLWLHKLIILRQGNFSGKYSGITTVKAVLS